MVEKGFRKNAVNIFKNIIISKRMTGLLINLSSRQLYIGVLLLYKTNIEHILFFYIHFYNIPVRLKES